MIHLAMPPAVPENLALTLPEPSAVVEKAAKSVVGIIYPPPEVRNIVDKTASFVARNGPEFESRIRQNELNNPKFNFLNSGDPYHAYYQHKVKEFREGKAELAPASGGLGIPMGLPLALMAPPPSVPAVRDGQEMFRSITEKPVIITDPPPTYEFIADPPSISALDLDIVKLTAQFVARNGRQFLTNLMNREQRNYQFDFLRPQHSLFQYFTRLLEQYTKVLIPPKDLMQQLDEEAVGSAKVVDKVRYRVEWQRAQEARLRSEEEALERERVSYAQIGWHDFVVVETVDYQSWEQGQFPPPTTPQQVGQRVLMQDRLDDGEEMQMSDDEDAGEEDGAAAEDRQDASSSDSDAASDDDAADTPVKRPDDLMVDRRRGTPPPPGGAHDDNGVQDMDEDSDEEREEARRTPGPPPQLHLQPPKPDQVLVKKYNPKAVLKPSRAPASDEFLVSPITGERIPANQVAEHMRIGLLDPRWVEQRDRQLNEKTGQETVYATGFDISSHLQNLAERRTDIFGAGDEETGIGQKIGEEEARQDDKAIWDGHSGTVDSTARAARANISVDEQISQIHRSSGLLEDRDLQKIGPKKTAGGSGDYQQQQQQRGGAGRPPAPPSIQQPRPPPPAPPSIQKPRPPPLPPASEPPPPGSAMPPAPPLPPAMSAAAPPLPPGSSEPDPPLPPGSGEPEPPPPPPISMQQLPVAPQPRMLPQPPLLMRPIGQPLLPGGPGVMMAPRPQILLPTRPMFAMHPAMQPGFMHPMAPGAAGSSVGLITPQQMMVVGGPGPCLIDDDFGPPAKKQRTEDSLMPENLWLARSATGQVTFTVSVPLAADKPEWRLNGQRLTLTMPLTDMVSVVKARLHDETALPPGKQKLLYEGIFFKDSNSLAYYNISNGMNIQLQLKERGGRKK